MRETFLLWGLVGLMSLPSAARAQTLADIARAEQARRKTVTAPVKIYTNDDLRRAGDDSIPPPVQPAAAPAPGAKPADAAKPEPPKPEPPAPDGPAKDEKFWRDRIVTARATLTRNKVLADALQSRINALTVDFANTADPAQRAVVEDNRKTAIAELDRMNKEIVAQNKAISDIEEEARKANVPPGWLR